MANKYGLTIDLKKSKPALLNLMVDLYESVVRLNSGEDEYQFAIKITLLNEAWDRRLSGSLPNLPYAISSVIGYTFRDTIETKNSIYNGTLITSPKQRGLELMKEPYRYRLEQVINDGLEFYVKKWYNGNLPSELKNVYLTLRDNVADPSLEMDRRKFVPLNKFKSLS